MVVSKSVLKFSSWKKRPTGPRANAAKAAWLSVNVRQRSIMSTQELFGYIIGLASILPAAALTGKYVTVWITRFRVAYSRALLSTGIAYVVTMILGILIQFSGPMSPGTNGARILAGVIILAACNVRFLRSATGDQLSFVQAVFVAVLQAIGGIVGLFLVLLLALVIKKLVS